MNARILFLLALLGGAGCAHSGNSPAPWAASAAPERTTFIDRRSQQLIRSGAPSDAALAKAQSEWAALETIERQRTAGRESEQQRQIQNGLARMSRERNDEGR